MINEDSYEEYCMEKLHLEEELASLESRLEDLYEEIKGVKSDMNFTKNLLDNLEEGDFVYE